MVYPIAVLLMAIAVSALLITVALPPLVGLFTSFGTELPWATSLVIAIADYPASSFFAEVWFEAGFFRCMVRRFHIHVETLQSESFDNLKEEICNRFGWS